jgi:hypothetical protein
MLVRLTSPATEFEPQDRISRLAFLFKQPGRRAHRGACLLEGISMKEDLIRVDGRIACREALV